MPLRPPHLLPLTSLVALLLIDLLIKAWASQTLSGQPVRSVIPGMLSLNYTLNPGMAWGLLGGLTAPLAIMRLLVGLGIMVALWRLRLRAVTAFFLAFVSAGALSNAVDGLTRGAVVDYLSSPLLDSLSQRLSAQPFPVFNLADVLVLVGAVGLFLTQPPQQLRSQSPIDPRPKGDQ